MKATRWNPEDGELSVELLRKRFPRNQFRVSPRSYPAGTRSVAFSRAGTVYVLAGRCHFRVGDQEIACCAGDVVEIPEGRQDIIVPETSSVQFVQVWDLRWFFGAMN